MTRPVVLREQAENDVQGAVDYYRDEVSPRVAAGFVDDLANAYGLIAEHPAAGSPRFAYELDLPGLRFLALRRFSYLLFYVERDDAVDVWRILHAHRDIPAWLSDPTT